MLRTKAQSFYKPVHKPTPRVDEVSRHSAELVRRLIQTSAVVPKIRIVKWPCKVTTPLFRSCTSHRRGNLPAKVGSWFIRDASRSAGGGSMNEEQHSGQGAGPPGSDSASLNSGRLPDLLFEDIGAYLESEHGGDDDAPESGAKSRKSKGTARPEKVPPPISDEFLSRSDPRIMPRDQLIWALGRAATLGIDKEHLWQRFNEALTDVGEAQLTPSELCRTIQALAYAPKSAPLDEELLERLLRAFAKRVSDYTDEQLMRIIYGYGKLSAKRSIKMQKFLDFVSSEVVERGKKLRGWRKTRILQAVWHLPGIDNDFKVVLVAQVMEHIANLDSERFAVFVPMLVELRFHQRPGVVDKLNTVYKKKTRGWRSPQLLLRSGLPMILHDLMKASTMAGWLNRLHDLRVPPLFPSMPLSPRSEEEAAFPNSAAGDSADDMNEPVDQKVKHGAPSSRCKATEGLEILKITELVLRHERSSYLPLLPPKAIQLLETARQATLEPPENHQMLELPFVFGELSRLFRELGLLLHPTIHGPYLLELTDPFGKVVVEWDTNWALYPPWRRTHHETYVRHKHVHLRAEGWRLICIPLAEFQSLETHEEKLEFLRRFAEHHDLSDLKI